MRYIALCPRGLEDVTQKEIKEILNVSSQVLAPGRVAFSASRIVRFLKKTRSVIKVYQLKQHCSRLEDIHPFPLVSPFRVVCLIFGSFGSSSQDVERSVGETFFLQGNTVALENPKTIVFVDIVDQGIFVGIDESPELLSKRKYRVKIHNQSLHACVAYGIVRLSGYRKGNVFLDPFCRDGIIPLEAALYIKGRIFAYDAFFPNVRSTEINAILAGVRKKITVARIDVEWLDTKFHEGEVDCIVSAVPYPSRTQKENEVKKLYRQFFSTASFILKKNGRLVCVAPQLDLFKEMCERFTLVEERIVSSSALSLALVVFKK